MTGVEGGGRCEDAENISVQSAVYIQAYVEISMNFVLVRVSVCNHLSGMTQDAFMILKKKRELFPLHAMMA